MQRESGITASPDRQAFFTNLALAGTVLALTLSPGFAQAARPGYCGHPNQKACTVWEYIPSCASGLVEWPPGHCEKGDAGTVVNNLLRSGADLTKQELKHEVASAKKVFKTTVSGTAQIYNQTAAGIKKLYNSTKKLTLWTNSAANFAKEYGSDLGKLTWRVEHLKGKNRQALNRILREIPTGNFDDQAHRDMLTVARALGLMSNQPGHLFANVTDPAFGIFVQGNLNAAGNGAQIGGNGRVVFLQDTAPDSSGVEHYGIVTTVGGVVGVGNSTGVSGTFGITFQPASVAKSQGGFVGVAGNVGAAAVKGGVGLRWKVYAGESGAQHAIPSFSVMFTYSPDGISSSTVLSGSATVGGGYSHVAGISESGGSDWAGVPHSRPPSDSDVIYTINSSGALTFYQMNSHGKLFGSGTIGSGWGGMDFFTAGDDGELWVVESGNLYFYKHDSHMNWLVEGEKIGDGGWNSHFGYGGLKKIMAAGDYHDSHGDLHRILFALDNTNHLWYYNFGTAPDGKIEDVAPKVVGWDWGVCKQTFTGVNGVIYCIHENGAMYRYPYNLRDTGGTPPAQYVSGGWNGYSHIFGGTNGQYFGLRKSDDALLVFHDLDDSRGQIWTSNGQMISTFTDAKKFAALKN